MKKSCNLCKLVVLFLVLVLSQYVYADKTPQNSIFVKSSNVTAANAHYTFSSASGNGLNYIEYCFASDNTCGTCVTPILFTPLSNTLPYGSYTISTAALSNLLKQTGTGIGTYNIKMSVLSTALTCSAGSAYCKGTQDSANHALCLTTVYDGNTVSSVTQDDNGLVTLDSPTKQYLYVVNPLEDNHLIQCSINSFGSVSSSCILVPSSGAAIEFGEPYSITVTTINNNQYAYVAGREFNTVPSTITACEIGSSGEFVPNSCVQDTTTFLGQDINTITIATQGESQYAYITYTTSNNAGITKCNLNTSTAVAGCTNAAPDQDLGNPKGMTFSTTNNTKYAYLTDKENSAILKCDVDTYGILSNCAVTGSGGITSNWKPYDIKFAYSANNTKYAYVANFDHNNIAKCDVNTSSGALENCVATPSSNPPNWQPIQISFSVSDGHLYAYVADSHTLGSVQKCTVQSNGDLANCSVISQLQTQYFGSLLVGTEFVYTAP